MHLRSGMETPSICCEPSNSEANQSDDKKLVDLEPSSLDFESPSFDFEPLSLDYEPTVKKQRGDVSS